MKKLALLLVLSVAGCSQPPRNKIQMEPVFKPSNFDRIETSAPIAHNLSAGVCLGCQTEEK